MDGVYKINNTLQRYVVPIKLNCDFDKAVNLIDGEMTEDETKVWKREMSSAYILSEQLKSSDEGNDKKNSIKNIESDLYEYVKDEFLFDGEPNDEKQGYSWEYNILEGKDPQKYIRKLLYMTEENSKNGTIEGSTIIYLSRLGLKLFRNGLGLIWYEFRLVNDNRIKCIYIDEKGNLKERDDDSFDSETLKHFQNIIKELNVNRNHRVNLWDYSYEMETIINGQMQGEHKKKDKSKKYGAVIKLPEIKWDNKENKEIKKRGYVHIYPFLIGEWIQNCLDGLKDYEFLTQAKSAYCSNLENYEKFLGKLSNGKWDVDIIGKREDVSVHKVGPDKAILFSYYGLLNNYENSEENESEKEQKQRNKLAYYLNNGYKDSYDFCEDIIQNMRHPFGNVIWCATKEGVSYTSWADKSDKENRGFFNNTIVTKCREDYFKLFIKILYQSFSLLLYADRIRKDVPAVLGKDIPDEDEQKITALYKEISLFLTKSMATSVSYIHHQSEFYIYLREMLRVTDDVKSVTSGLEQIKALLDAERERAEKEKLRADEAKEKEKEKREEEERRLKEAKEKEKEKREEEERRSKEAKEKEKERQEKEERSLVEEREKRNNNKIQAVMTIFAILSIFSAITDSYGFVTAVFKSDSEDPYWIVRTVIGLIITVLIIVFSIYIFRYIHPIKLLNEIKKQERQEKEEDDEKL